MSVEHKNLTGASLHEPKGVATAGADTAYMADGAGSGAWTDPLASVNNKNLIVVTSSIPDLSNPADHCVIPAPLACSVVNVAVVCEANFATAPNVLTAEVVSTGVAYGAGTATNLNLSCTHGSGVNTVFKQAVSTGNTMTTSQALWIRTSGAGVGASPGQVVVTLDVS
jgi:hypothetical protein|tara:strand:+ start:826 stop:1329 length:504 start_codon:yes stop_codon:yes gene_type:complete